jgi:F-type H+-transporting ATPase subunit a
MLSMALIPEMAEYHIPHVPGYMMPLVMTWIVWLVLGIVSVMVVSRLKLVPTMLQTTLEAVFGFVFDMADEIIGQKDSRRYYPLFAGLFLYILVSNLLGLIPFLNSPTANINTTYALVLVVFLFYNYDGIRRNGWGYLKQFMGPPLPWYFFPISILLVITEIVTFVMRPFSLGLRLFCNIFSKEMFLAVLGFLIVQFFVSPDLIQKLFTVAPLVLRPLIILLGLIIGVIQALVFVVLSMSYIAGALQAGHH